MATTRERAHLVLLVARRRRRQEPARERARRHRQVRARRVRADGRVPPLRRPERVRTRSPRRSARRPASTARAPTAKGRHQGPDRGEDHARCSAPTPSPPSSNASPEGCCSSSRASRGPASTRAARATKRCARPSRCSRRWRRRCRSCSCSPISTGPPTTRSSSASGSSAVCATGRSCSSRPRVPTSRRAGHPSPASTTASRSSSIPSTSRRPASSYRALLDGDADHDVVTLLLERSGGNPFFIEELVAFMQESGDPAAHPRGARRRCTACSPPASTRSTPAERSLLEDCAVVGANGPISAVIAARRPRPTRPSCSNGSPNAISSSSTTTSSTSSPTSSTRSRTGR